MADTPKAPRAKATPKTSSTTLSASEALKAAEAAIAPPAKTSPAQAAPAPRKPAQPKPKPAVDPVAVAAASTAVDAAPEPVELPPAPEPDSVKTMPADAMPLPALEGTMTMNDVIETGKKFAEETKAKLESVYADMNEKAKAGVEKSTKALEEMSDIAKGNVEALVESGKIAAKGLETFGQEAVDYSRKSFEKATASMKTFSGVKTPTEFFQLQSQFLSSTFDDFTKEAAKNGEALIKLAGDVAQPLTARVTVVTDKVKSLAA
ncbi:phasin family protein [Sphingobium ummariense]|uniref:Phasin domain-containing protein n=1 Tax=Sphingobium ummariense RL-3 TaxID=1346791 RepID=T0K849_9SPHN|nr:phasin family protein [Sphingobium ummariense]EQB32834.1 hypothetical protein M529_07290 [Sphingobium ummariense RL-3]